MRLKKICAVRSTNNIVWCSRDKQSQASRARHPLKRTLDVKCAEGTKQKLKEDKQDTQTDDTSPSLGTAL